jgi:hypothetical protein
MVVEFELDGQAFTALNGGPQFKFSEAFVGRELQRPAGSGLLLGQLTPAAARRAVRLAQGQVRPVVAGGARRGDRDDVGSRPREIAARAMGA